MAVRAEGVDVDLAAVGGAGEAVVGVAGQELAEGRQGGGGDVGHAPGLTTTEADASLDAAPAECVGCGV